MMDKMTSAAVIRRQRKRQLKDRLANFTIGLGGVSVIVAIALIFFYLLFEVWPLFKGAEVEKGAPVAIMRIIASTRSSA